MIKSTLALYFDTLRETRMPSCAGPSSGSFSWAYRGHHRGQHHLGAARPGIIGGFIIGFGAVYLYGAYLRGGAERLPTQCARDRNHP